MDNPTQTTVQTSAQSTPQNFDLMKINENDSGMNIIANKKQVFEKNLSTDAMNMHTQFAITMPSLPSNKPAAAQQQTKKIATAAVMQQYGKQTIARDLQQRQELRDQAEDQQAQEQEIAKDENEQMKKAEEQYAQQAQQQEKINTQRTYNITTIKPNPNNFVRNALIVGGVSSAAAIALPTAFTIFFG